jgi:hypothetical protein
MLFCQYWSEINTYSNKSNGRKTVLRSKQSYISKIVMASTAVKKNKIMFYRILKVKNVISNPLISNELCPVLFFVLLTCPDLTA